MLKIFKKGIYRNTGQQARAEQEQGGGDAPWAGRENQYLAICPA